MIETGIDLQLQKASDRFQTNLSQAGVAPGCNRFPRRAKETVRPIS
jgi:hypothetical protein